MKRLDSAGLGRGPLTRWLPVMGQAPTAPDTPPFQIKTGDSPGRFLARVLFSLPRITIPALLLSIVWQVGESAVPVVMGTAIDRALTTSDATQLVVWIGVLVGLYVTLTTAARLSLRLTVAAQQRMEHRLRATLSNTVLHPAGGTARGVDGGVVSLMTNDVARVGVARLVIGFIANIAAIGFIAVALLATHWILGLVVLLGAPTVVWLMGQFSKRYSRDTREYQGLLASTVGRATDLVAGYRTIKGVRAEAEATRRYRQASQETLVGAQRNVGLLGRFLAGSGAISAVFVAVVAGLAGWFAVDGQLSIGELITAVGLTQALLPQVQSLAAGAIPVIASARASSARILDTLTDAETSRHLPDGATRSQITPVPVLDVHVCGATIRIEPGELIGVQADDQTAARITTALLDPQATNGVDVRLDNLKGRELPPGEYRSRVTVAPHHAVLFSGTIRDNLTGSTDDPDLTNADRLGQALHAAACEDFAIDLDTPVGEGGNRLSGGQRQRVALARAMTADAPVLVLHDPTTAVDSVTEQVIAARLREVRAGCSTLLIASSPALLGVCDRVINLLTEAPVRGTAISGSATW